LTLDFLDADREIVPQHLAFIVTDSELDQILKRTKDRRQVYWANPFHHQANRLKGDNGGREFYFEDPSGHNLEALTVP